MLIITSRLVAQLGERQTEDLNVPGSTPGLGTSCMHTSSHGTREGLSE